MPEMPRARTPQPRPDQARRAGTRLGDTLAAVLHDRPALVVGGAMLAVAGAFILADTLANALLAPGWDADSALSLIHAGQPAHRFKQFEFATVATLLAVAALRSREAIHAAWALLFAFLLVDGLVSGHTRIALHLFAMVDAPRFWRLRPEQVGKDLVWLAYAAVWSVVLAVALRLSSPPHRRLGLVMLIPALAYFFFAFVVDMVQLKVAMDLRRLGAVIEEGGELVTLALAGGVAAHCAFRPLPDGRRGRGGAPARARGSAIRPGDGAGAPGG
ncbi:MAG: hypothetical protein RID91_19715 [Azospirillaceae bacterium]